MNKTPNILSLLGVFLLGIALYSIYSSEGLYSLTKNIGFLILFLVLPISFLCIARISWNMNRKFSVFLWLTTLTLLISTNIFNAEDYIDLQFLRNLKNTLQIIVISSYVLSSMGVIVSVPFMLLPLLRKKQLPLKHKSEIKQDKPDTSTILKSFDNIREIYSKMRSVVDKEADTLEGSINSLLTDIKGQQDLLRQSKTELEDTCKELEEYKALLSLSEEQQAAFFEAVREAKISRLFYWICAGNYWFSTGYAI